MDGMEGIAGGISGAERDGTHQPSPLRRTGSGWAVCARPFLGGGLSTERAEPHLAARGLASGATSPPKRTPLAGAGVRGSTPEPPRPSNPRSARFAQPPANGGGGSGDGPTFASGLPADRGSGLRGMVAVPSHGDRRAGSAKAGLSRIRWPRLGGWRPTHAGERNTPADRAAEAWGRPISPRRSGGNTQPSGSIRMVK
jgi:hypothetical protein